MGQTNLSLRQLSDYLTGKKQQSDYPECLLANEVGQIFHEKKDDGSKNLLLKLLKDEDRGIRVISYCFLFSADEKVKKSYQRSLSYFRQKPENKKLLPKIEKLLKAF